MFYNQQSQIDNTKLYTILGVNNSSSENEIKKSYKKLAMKYHPDRNNGDKTAESKFKEISYAYSIIGNKEKKDLYDKFGEEGVNQSGGPGVNVDPFGMFGNFFGMKNEMKRKTRDRIEEIEVSLESVYNEKNIKIRYKKNIICQPCAGSGATDTSQIRTCDICNGTGSVVKMQQIAPGFVTQSQTVCTKCMGKGKLIAEENICKYCNGNKIHKKTHYLNLKLSRDTRHGEKILFQGESDQSPDADEYGDFIVQILIKKHDRFKIKDHKNLYYLKHINLKEALCGAEFTIEHLDKEQMYISVDTVIKPFSKKTVRNKGLSGDLIIEFYVVFPEKIDNERQLYLNKILDIYFKKTEDEISDETKKNIYYLEDYEEYKEDEHFNRNTNVFENLNDNLDTETVGCQQQ
jgi:DnaJ-class molecular chaperone